MQADEIECQVLLGRSLLWSVMPACFATAETAANLLAAATTACRLLLSEQSTASVRPEYGVSGSGGLSFSVMVSMECRRSSTRCMRPGHSKMCG